MVVAGRRDKNVLLCPARHRDCHTLFFDSLLFDSFKKCPSAVRSIFSCIIAIALPILGTRRSKGNQSKGTINPLRAMVLVWGKTPIFFHFLQAAKVRRNHLPTAPPPITITNHNRCHVNKRFRCSTWCRGEYLWRNFHSG